MSIPILVRGRSLLGLSKGLGVGVGLLGLARCAATDPPPLGSLEPNSTTFPGVVQSVSTMTGTSTTGPMMACVPEAPASDHISDFSDWVGTAWGEGSALTGSSFKYVGAAPTAIDYQVDLMQENMHITATVVDYAGFGMSIDACTDAAAAGFSGIQFDLWGSAGSAVFQVQTSEDHDKQYDDRATCPMQEGDTCAVPQASIATVTETPTTLSFAWANFAGGSPVPTLSPNQILGLQWQFQCGEAEPCVVDVRLDNVKFY